MGSSFEREFEAAIEAKDLPGATLVASDLTGKLQYWKSFGLQHLDDANSRPLDANPVFWAASCTKLMTTVAAMQAVERGHFTLDEDVTRLLPEWKDVEIITGFEEGSDKPILVKNTTPITLRQMLTHSSGIAYDHFNPILQRYRSWRNFPFSMKGAGRISENYFYPLTFEPGTAWEYGAGIDWAGIMTRRANGSISLEDYMKKNIWEPLGMVDTTFHLETRPDMRARWVDMARREGGSDPLLGIPSNPDGKIDKSSDRVWPDPIEYESGGAGAYTTPADYHKLLRSLCANDGKVLKKETVDEMFKPQLSEASREKLNAFLSTPQMCLAVQSPLVPGSELDWGLGGMLTVGPTTYGMGPARSRGTMFWSGLPNLFWWMDGGAGLMGTYFSQLMPQGDTRTILMLRKFEVAMYERLSRASL